METRKSPLPSRRHSESLPTTAAQTTLSRHDDVITVSSSCAEGLVLNKQQRFNQPVQSAASPNTSLCTRKQAMEKENHPKSAPDQSLCEASTLTGTHSTAPSSPLEVAASHLTQQGLRRLHMRSEDIDCLWTASIDPPITKESLSQLDLNAIVENARLRHDLNFEPDIVFRPNMYGERGQQKKLEEKRYFNALIIEFEIYFQRHRPKASLSDYQRNTPGTVSHVRAQQDPPTRLPRMLIAIRDVIKTLVPNDKWAIVDEQFDVDLRMQELTYGAFDVAQLVEWLGKLLLGSCPPLRDQMVITMVSNTRRGIEAQDARQLVNGLQELFAVLETMKLVRMLKLHASGPS